MLLVHCQPSLISLQASIGFPHLQMIITRKFTKCSPSGMHMHAGQAPQKPVPPPPPFPMPHVLRSDRKTGDTMSTNSACSGHESYSASHRLVLLFRKEA